MQIDSYDFGMLKIDGKLYQRDVVIFPEKIFSPWQRKESHYLAMEDLMVIPDLLKESPETVIIGTGYSGVMEIDPKVEEFLKSKGIEVIIEKTIDAWKTYNELSKNKKTAALLHLTC
jgi:hypothetical protein